MLCQLLRDVRIQDGGIEVVFYGADKGMEKVRDTDIERSFGRT
jgi:hypothetical protein